MSRVIIDQMKAGCMREEREQYCISDLTERRAVVLVEAGPAGETTM